MDHANLVSPGYNEEAKNVPSIPLVPVSAVLPHDFACVPGYDNTSPVEVSPSVIKAPSVGPDEEDVPESPAASGLVHVKSNAVMSMG